MATNLAKAYVQIIPSAEGISGSISNVLGGESTSAGEKAGENIASSLCGKLKTALVSLGIGKIITDAIGDASEFETSMAKVSTLFGGSESEFQDLQNNILALSSSYGLGATTLAEAAYSAESAGVPMEQLTEMLSGSAALAVAGFTDIDTALSATAKTMNAYGDAAGSIDEIQKILIQTQNLGITTVGELGASLANVTPTAAAMGVGFDQVGAALAQMTANGVPTAQATTQLRAAMSELGKSGTKAALAFESAAEGTAYAGMSFQEAMASGANLGDVFSIMQSYADASGLSMLDLWSSVEAGNAAMAIAADVDKFNDNLEQMSTDADVVGEAYGKMADTFGTSMNQLKESAKNFMTTLFNGGDISASFDQMLSSLGNVGEKLGTWLMNGLTSLAENLPQMMSSLLDFGDSILASLAEVDWISLGTTILNGIIGALGELGTWLIELIGSGISAVVNGDVDFGAIGNAIWDGVTSVITTAGDWLSTLFSTAVSAITGEDGVEFDGIGTAILGGVTSAIDTAGTFLSSLFTAGKDTITSDTFGWKSVGDVIKTGVTGAIDTAGKFLEGAFTAGKTLITAIDWSTVGTAIGDGVTGTIDVAGAFLSGGFEAAKTAIEKIDWGNIGTVIGDAVNGVVDTAGAFLSGCFDTAKTAIEEIEWSNIGTVIGNGVNGVIDVEGAFLSGCFDAAKTAIEGIEWGNIGTVISDAVNGVVDTAGAFLSGSFEAAKTAIEGIEWSNIGTTIADGVNGTIDTAGEFLEGWFDAGRALAEALDWSGIGTKIGEGVNGTIDTAGEFLETCFSGGLDLVKAIQWGDIGTKISDGITGTIDAAGEFLEAPFKAGKELIEAINWTEVGSAIQTGLGDVWSGFTSMLGGTMSGVGSAVEGAGEFVGKGLTNLSDLLFGSDLDQLTQAKEDLETAMSDLETAITDGTENLKTAAQDAGKAIADGIKGELDSETMKTVGKTAADTVINNIKSEAVLKKSEVETKFGNIRDAAAEKFKDATGTTWDDAGEYAITKISSAAGTNATTLNTQIETIRNGATAAMKDYVSWVGVGQNIVQGIVNGIKAWQYYLYNTMYTLASNALAAAQNALGISSPSKVMRDQVGRWIPEGIAEGIAENGDIVSTAMSEMADDIAATDMSGAAISQGNRLGEIASWNEPTDAAGAGGLIDRIVEAVRQGMEQAEIPVYMDGRLVSDSVNGYLTDGLRARRFV